MPETTAAPEILSSMLCKRAEAKPDSQELQMTLDHWERAFWVGTLWHKLNMKIYKTGPAEERPNRDNIVMEFDNDPVDRELPKHWQHHYKEQT
jgi:hypothetical protein